MNDARSFIEGGTRNGDRMNAEQPAARTDTVNATCAVRSWTRALRHTQEIINAYHYPNLNRRGAAKTSFVDDLPDPDELNTSATVRPRGRSARASSGNVSRRAAKRRSNATRRSSCAGSEPRL